MPKATPSNGYWSKYNLWWEPLVSPILVELEMIKSGGHIRKRDGTLCGEGLAFHFKQAIRLLWPHIVFHAWNNLIIDNYLTHRTIVCIGAASTGKTNTAATCILLDYYVFPDCTTGIVSSTTRERLEDRVWGEIKKLHKDAKKRFSWIPGHLIEGKQRIVTDSKDESEEGRDFRNGIVGVAARVGQSYTGIQNFVGLKNKRMRVVLDELQLLPASVVNSISNLDKNEDLRVFGLGNPKDTTDALGVLGEPSARLGGWDGGIDQTPTTKTWETKRKDGICIQLVGSDSPNLDGKLGIPLITQEQIDRDISFYGKDSLWFTMMDQGMMPKGEGSRRVVTRAMCLKYGALEQPVWQDNKRVSIGCCDAAYMATGGDRSIFGELQFGKDFKGQQIIALIDLIVIPVAGGIKDLPEEQIAQFCMEQCAARNISAENFFFDSTGRGSLALALARLWSPNVRGIEFGGKPSDRPVSSQITTLAKDYYSKRVSELWFAFRHTVLAAQFRGLDEDTMSEFISREWKIVGANRTEVEIKDEVKLKIGRSPDKGDCVVVGLEGARQRGFVIANTSAKPVSSNQKWKEDLLKRTARIHQSHTLTYR